MRARPRPWPAPPARPRRRHASQLVELRRRFGEVSALDGLSLELAPGELVALLGPSGCGKTTALRALAGLERLDSGRVLVDGRDITDMPANRRDMGMVFQAYSLFPHLTARENVAFGLRLRRIGERRAAQGRPTGCSSWSTSPTQGDRYPHELSGGQQQRVALARALAIEPQVLLLDEPLSALDAKVRATSCATRSAGSRLEVGITTLFVTHDQDEALAIADRVAVIFAGQVAQIARPGRALRAAAQRPASPSSSASPTASAAKPATARRSCWTPASRCSKARPPRGR